MNTFFKYFKKIFYELPIGSYEIILLLIFIIINTPKVEKFVLNYCGGKIKFFYYYSKTFSTTYNKGNSWKIISYSTKGIKLLRKINIILPLEEVLYTFRALAKYLIDDYKGAMSDCNKAISCNPEYTYAYFVLTLLYNNKREYKKEIEVYNKIIDLGEKQCISVAYYNRAITNKVLNKYNDLKKDLFSAIKENPKYAQAYYERACYYYEHTNFIGFAISDLNTIINIDKTHAYAHGLKALILFEKQKYDEAIELLKKAEKNCTQKEVIYNALSYIYYVKNNFKKSLLYANRALLYNKENGTAYYRKACALISLGQYKNAGKFIKKANELEYYDCF